MEINHIILKVASICNLSCDYCYVFNKQDKSYLIQNNVMTYEIARTLINRIEKYLLDIKKNENIIEQKYKEVKDWYDEQS